MVIGWDEETSLQMERAAAEPAGEELKKSKTQYLNCWSDGRAKEHWPGTAYFGVKPNWIGFSRYSNPPTLPEFDDLID